MTALGEVLAPVITIAGSGVLAYVTSRTARKTQEVVNAGQVEQVTTEGRLTIEDKAYERAESYWQNALRDARREVAETRKDLETERQERREEVGILNAQLGRERSERQQETAELRQRVSAAEDRAARAREAARALARRVGQPDPDL